MELSSAPRFRVLDGVVPVDEPEGPGVLAVTSVWRYEDGSYRYVIAAAGPSSDDREGLYHEAQLLPTGTRVSLDVFAPPGPFTVREIVVVSDAYPDGEVAGEEAEVLGWTYADQRVEYAVWVPSLQCVWCIDVNDLRPTGRRLPAPDRDRPVQSLHIAPSGQAVGNSEYQIVDDVQDLR